MKNQQEKTFKKREQKAFQKLIKEVDKISDFPSSNRQEKSKAVILDNNELSIFEYAKEFPENWKKMTEQKEKPKTPDAKMQKLKSSKRPLLGDEVTPSGVQNQEKPNWKIVNKILNIGIKEENVEPFDDGSFQVNEEILNKIFIAGRLKTIEEIKEIIDKKQEEVNPMCKLPFNIAWIRVCKELLQEINSKEEKA